MPLYKKNEFMRHQKFGFRTEQPFYRWTQRTTSVIFGALGKLESHGNENIPRRGGVLLLSNHVSYLDPFIIGTAANREIHYMARHDVFRIPGLSQFITALNAYPVRRGVADRAALKHTLSLLKAGKAVLIFPEGTRSVDGTLGKAHDGVSFIVHSADVPTIPVFLKGTMLPRNAKCIRPTQLSATFGLPLDFNEVRQIADRRQLYRRMGEQIMQSIAELRDESANRLMRK
jgi:1-acyl-sn-glycerol-3-phosphate acyltransferase